MMQTPSNVQHPAKPKKISAAKNGRLPAKQLQVLPQMLKSAVSPEHRIHKFLLEFLNMPRYTIASDFEVTACEGIMSSPDDIGIAACSLVHFCLQKSLRIEVSVTDAFTTGKKRKPQPSQADDPCKRIKGSNGKSIPVHQTYTRLAEFKCRATNKLWFGRKKISKAVKATQGSNPLKHELAITEAQVSKPGIDIDNICLPKSEKLCFTVEVWQKFNESTCVLVTADTNSDAKVSQAHMLPMFMYLTSLCQTLQKKLKLYVMPSAPKLPAVEEK